jgi:hypothetical protein
VDTFEQKVVDKFGGKFFRAFARNFPPWFLAMALGACAIMLFYPSEHVRVYSERIEPNPAYPGQRAELVYQADNTQSCDGVVHKWIVDSLGTVHEIATEPAAFHSTEASVSWYYKSFNVPLGVALGPALYKSHVVRYCNVVQEFIWPTTSDYVVPFIIEEKKP